MRTDCLKELPELEIAVMAKSGDKNAAELLWEKYRKPMTNVFWGLPMTPAERESEAADVFMHYIKNLFDPERDVNKKKDWKFFSYLYSGMIGRRSKLRKARTFLTYDESESGFEEESASKAVNAEKACLVNRELFLRYDPEYAVMSAFDREKEKPVRDRFKRLREIRASYASRVLGLLAGVKA
jgi:hypothetical protein